MSVSEKTQISNDVKPFVNFDFHVDTAYQSFVTAPTNHIEICDADSDVTIEIGTIVYGQIDYKLPLENIQIIYNKLVYLALDLSDYVQMNFSGGNGLNITFGGLNNSQETYHFSSVQDLLDRVETVYKTEYLNEMEVID
ncbi:hypothetical protein NVP1084O_235 [Vibrio phage 1.084.O._10N.261.49.F5]|nr:hypothetical protein NVP1084O_235 [Vibrio phage 1.084.O._10N.261.49.F5]